MLSLERQLRLAEAEVEAVGRSSRHQNTLAEAVPGLHAGPCYYNTTQAFQPPGRNASSFTLIDVLEGPSPR